jgi:hypothetical protein
MKRMLILASVAALSIYAGIVKADPPPDPLLCNIANGKYTFRMDDSDFNALVGTLLNLDKSGSYTTTPEQTKAAFVAKSEDSKSRQSICQTRMIVRMLRDGRPRQATWHDISESGDFRNFSPGFMPKELKLLDPILKVPVGQ